MKLWVWRNEDLYVGVDEPYKDDWSETWGSSDSVGFCKKGASIFAKLAGCRLPKVGAPPVQFEVTGGGKAKRVKTWKAQSDPQ